MNSLHCCIGLVGLLMIIFGCWGWARFVLRPKYMPKSEKHLEWHDRMGPLEWIDADGMKHQYVGSRRGYWDWHDIKSIKEL